MKEIRAGLGWLCMFLFCFGLAMVGMLSRHPVSRVAAAVQQEDPHASQPDHCTNAKNAPAAHKCDCKKTANACDLEDRKCRVYCRKNHCHCFHPECDS
jgi:hypothetical protein